MRFSSKPIKRISDDSFNRLIAIGDIHGCIDELETLLLYLKEVEKITDEDQLIFVGDYIDRGPDSPGVVEILIQLKKEFPKTIFLRGNHEDMLLGSVGEEGLYGNDFWRNGGYETMNQYKERFDVDFWEQFPEEHRNFFLNLDWIVATDSYYFVHAGFDPFNGVDSIHEDLVWIRERFILDTQRNYDNKIVIHGHTPMRVIGYRENAIGIDTGCVYAYTQFAEHYSNSKLTCLNLTNKEAYQIPSKQNIVQIQKWEDIVNRKDAHAPEEEEES